MIHSKIRLAVISILISVKEADFNYLKKTIGTTDGNLSNHLSKLEEKDYLAVKKAFKGKKPRTTYAITKKGKKAFSKYLEVLEDLLHLNKGGKFLLQIDNVRLK